MASFKQSKQFRNRHTHTSAFDVSRLFLPPFARTVIIPNIKTIALFATTEMKLTRSGYKLGTQLFCGCPASVPNTSNGSKKHFGHIFQDCGAAKVIEFMAAAAAAARPAKAKKMSMSCGKKASGYMPYTAPCDIGSRVRIFNDQIGFSMHDDGHTESYTSNNNIMVEFQDAFCRKRNYPICKAFEAFEHFLLYVSRVAIVVAYTITTSFCCCCCGW